MDEPTIERPHEKFDVPQFNPVIEETILKAWHTISPELQFLIRQGSIREQQMAWVMNKLQEGHAKMEYFDAKISAFDRLASTLTAKKSVVLMVLSLFGIPGLLILIGAIVKRAFEK